MCRESTKDSKRTRALIFSSHFIISPMQVFYSTIELLGYICSDIQIKYVFRDIKLQDNFLKFSIKHMLYVFIGIALQRRF